MMISINPCLNNKSGNVEFDRDKMVWLSVDAIVRLISSFADEIVTFDDNSYRFIDKLITIDRDHIIITQYVFEQIGTNNLYTFTVCSNRFNRFEKWMYLTEFVNGEELVCLKRVSVNHSNKVCYQYV